MRFRRPILVVVISIFLQVGCQNEAQQQPADKIVDQAPAAKPGTNEPSYKGRTVAELIAIANSKTDEDRWKAYEDFGRIDYRGADELRGKVITFLGAKLRDGDMHYAASGALKRFGKYAVPVYAESLTDKCVEVRRRAAHDLGTVWEWRHSGNRDVDSKIDEDSFPVPFEPIIAALTGALKTDSDADVRQSAASSLARLEGEGVAVLIATLKGDDPKARKSALEGLRRLSNEQKRKAVPVLIERLGDGDDQFCSSVISTLSDLRNDAAEAAPALLKISAGHDQAAKSATSALSNITKVRGQPRQRWLAS